MKRVAVTLNNTFHRTTITLSAAVDAAGDLSLSPRQMAQADKALCGQTDCRCGVVRGGEWAPNGQVRGHVESDGIRREWMSSEDGGAFAVAES